MDNGKVSPLIKILSLAVIGHNDYPIGAIIIMGLIEKTDTPKYAAELVETAKNISPALGASRLSYRIVMLKEKSLDE